MTKYSFNYFLSTEGDMNEQFPLEQIYKNIMKELSCKLLNLTTFIYICYNNIIYYDI